MTTKFKTMQPKDWHETKVKFPCIIQPKIDGCAAYNPQGTLVGRSLKKHKNRFTTEKFSKEHFIGFGGEITTGDSPVGEDLCRITSGDLRREDSVVKHVWWLFDFITDEIKDLPYSERMKLLELHMQKYPSELFEDIRIIESFVVNNMEELLAKEEEFLDLGYEGAILRDPTLPYKYGDCGKSFMGAWRIKRFIDFEIIVTRLEEGEENNNPTKINERGRTERSTHAENMQPNGLVGSLYGNALQDVLDPQTGKVLIEKGQEVKLSAGKMKHDLRKFYFDNPDEIVGKISKGKFFPKGIKEKIRFPTWSCIRSSEDMPE